MTERHEDLQAASTKIGISRAGARTIIAPKASLNYQNCGELKSVLNASGQQVGSEIILDLKAVPFMDSEVLELVVRMHEDLKMRGGVLKIIGLNSVCRDILNATRLTNILNIFNDIKDAVRSMP
jgi:anti-anti-sigma factor